MIPFGAWSAFCRKVTNLQQMKAQRTRLEGKAKGGYEHMVGRFIFRNEIQKSWENRQLVQKYLKLEELHSQIFMALFAEFEKLNY